MSVIDLKTLKGRLTGTGNARLLKIAAGVLSLVSLLTISVFIGAGNTGPVSQGNTLNEDTPAGGLLPYRPDALDPAPTVKSLAYIRPDKVASVGKLLIFTIAASDPDGGPLSYSAASLPDGSSFDANTGTFSWTPRYDQAGVYSVRFEVSDGDLTDYEDVNITVVQLYNNWDVNGDSAANVLDMVLVGQHWGEFGLTGWIIEDTNEDGTINVLDLITVGQHWTG
jgi:hypothetical protein